MRRRYLEISPETNPVSGGLQSASGFRREVFKGDGDWLLHGSGLECVLERSQVRGFAGAGPSLLWREKAGFGCPSD